MLIILFCSCFFDWAGTGIDNRSWQKIVIYQQCLANRSTNFSRGGISKLSAEVYVKAAKIGKRYLFESSEQALAELRSI